jgi:pilus assembly protein CpaE
MVRAIKTYLTDKGIRVAGEATNLKAGMRVIRSLQPNLVLIEVPAEEPDETLEAVRDVRAEMPDCGIILSSENASPELILMGVRAGAQEFVKSPVVPEELETAIEHVRSRLERRTTSGRRRGKVITLFPSKGGSGCSMVATNLAAALARKAENRVVLVDLHFQLGDLELTLDVHPRYGLADVIGEATLEEAELRSVLTPHSSGLFLLTVSGSPEDGHKVERQHLSDVFGLLTNMFEYVVVDMERHIDERTLEILDRSERILLVSELNVPSARNTKRYLELFRRLEIDTTKLEVVVNRHDTKKGGVNVKELERTIGVGASWLIPNDYQVVNHSIDSGVPFVFGAPNSKLGRSFQEFAAQIATQPAGSKEKRPAPTPSQVT